MRTTAGCFLACTLASSLQHWGWGGVGVQARASGITPVPPLGPVVVAGSDSTVQGCGACVVTGTARGHLVDYPR
jgi:hypothetical protein